MHAASEPRYSFAITAPEFGYDEYAGLDVRGKAVLAFDHERREADPLSVFHGTGFTLHAHAWSKTRNAERRRGAASVLLATEPVNAHRSAPRAPDRANAPPQVLARSDLGIPRWTLPAEAAAAMLEVARIVAARPLPRSVLFVAFGSEEQLMLCSYHCVAHPLRPLETTRAVLNLEMVGRNEAHTPESEGAYEITAGRSDQLNLVGAAFGADLARLLEREAGRAGVALSDNFDCDSSMRALFRCDHLPFLQEGVPAVWIFGGFHPGGHEPADTIDRLDFDKLSRAVVLVTNVVRALAGAAPGQAEPGRSQAPAS